MTVDQSLATQFVASRLEPITVNGVVLHTQWHLTGLGADEFRVQRRHAGSRRQAACLRALSGRSEVAGMRDKGIILWSDTTPPVVTVRTHPPRGKTMTVRVWHAWTDELGDVQTMSANSAMRIESDGPMVHFRCRGDGAGDEFNDLVFDLAIAPAVSSD